MNLAGPWIEVALTLCIFSFLYRDNPLFKFAEHLFLGVSVGYLFIQVVFDTFKPKVVDPLSQGHWAVLVPVFFGLLVLTRAVPRLAWLSRWTFALIVGFGAGVAIPSIIHTNILSQIAGTIRPIPHRPEGGFSTYGMADLGTDFSNLLVIVGVLSVLVYFFYSIEHKGPIRHVARLGTLFLMVSFGAAFGYTVMARMSLLYGRCYDLCYYGSAAYGYATPVLLVVFALFLAVHRLRGGAGRDGSGGGA
ncbi:MAG: hypothetical protein HY608_02025 [Planctomycetes bacterium]|nr:hypothetical protein [Planctomycetota bacterium]